MALFEFKLKPLSDVMPWGQEPKLTLHWFGLNEDKRINGIQPWAAVRGDFALPLEEFEEEVRRFHNQLMAAMECRIVELKTNNPIPHVSIDIPSLEKEHEERKLSLERALNRAPRINDWGQVVRAINKLLDSAAEN